MVAALALSPVASPQLAMPPAPGDNDHPMLGCPPMTDMPAMMEAVKQTIDELTQMTANDWEARRDRARELVKAVEKQLLVGGLT